MLAVVPTSSWREAAERPRVGRALKVAVLSGHREVARAGGGAALSGTLVEFCSTSPRRTSVGAGTKEDPWVLTTPPGSSQYTMYRDPANDPPALVCQVGSTTLRYRLEAIEDLAQWLREQGESGRPRCRR